MTPPAQLSAEVLELLNAQTTLEQKVLEKFRTAGGSRVRVFCINGTKEECRWVCQERGLHI